MLQGSMLVQRGELEQGLALLDNSMTQYRRLGSQAFLPFVLAFLAEAYWRRGQVDSGLAVVTEALQLSETNFDCVWEADLHRLRGELLLAQAGRAPTGSGTAVAEACFERGLAIARRQGAKSLELRSAMSLSRLWQAQGKDNAAQTLLAGIYGWFSEGWETEDLRAARALLAGYPTTT